MAEKNSSWKKLIASIGVLCSFLLSPIFPKFATKRLLAGLDSPVEDASTAAYMALCKVGPKATNSLIHHIKQHGPTAGRLQLLGDLGDDSAIPFLEEFANSQDPAIAQAAQESLEFLSD